MKKIEKLAYEHYQTHKQVRKIAEVCLHLTAKKFSKVKNPSDFEKLTLILDRLNKIIDTSIKGERVATSLDYLDINRACETMLKFGYQVLDPNTDKLITEDNYENEKYLI